MTRARISSWLQRRRRGAVALVAVAAMVPVSAMIAANANTGQMVNERRMTQDAADALAAMHGSWTARSLNVISMNQVTATQLMTVAIGSEALAGTLQEIGIAVGTVSAAIATHIATECPTGVPEVDAVWVPICSGINGLQELPALLYGAQALMMNFEYQPGHGIDVSHRALRAIEGMNRAIVERFPATMAKIGKNYADDLGIDAFHFADPCNGYGTKGCSKTNTDDGMALPLEKGGLATRLEFCAGMEKGFFLFRHTTYSKRGFPNGKGPMTSGGSRSNPHVRDHIQATTRIDRLLKNFKDYYRSAILIGARGPRKFPQIANLQGPQTRSNNSFLRRFDAKRFSLCIVGGPKTGIINMITRLEIEAPVPTFWKLKDIAPTDTLVQPDQMPEAFHVLAFAQRTKGKRLATTVLKENVQSHFGYGQAGVYNPDGADLYSQNWRYRMMPASRMDDVSKAASDLSRQAKAPFRPLSRSLDAVSDTAGWEKINAH